MPVKIQLGRRLATSLDRSGWVKADDAVCWRIHNLQLERLSLESYKKLQEAIVDCWHQYNNVVLFVFFFIFSPVPCAWERRFT